MGVRILDSQGHIVDQKFLPESSLTVISIRENCVHSHFGVALSKSVSLLDQVRRIRILPCICDSIAVSIWTATSYRRHPCDELFDEKYTIATCETRSFCEFSPAETLRSHEILGQLWLSEKVAQFLRVPDMRVCISASALCIPRSYTYVSALF